MSSHDGGGFRFYRVLSAHIPGAGRCTTQVELVGDRLVLRPDTTSWFEVPLDHAAAHCLLDALTGDTPGIVRAQHPQNGATTVTVALHGSTASLRVENASKGTLHVVFDETQLPELIMHLEDGAAWLPHDALANVAPVVQVITEWRHTAEVHADPRARRPYPAGRRRLRSGPRARHPHVTQTTTSPRTSPPWTRHHRRPR